MSKDQKKDAIILGNSSVLRVLSFVLSLVMIFSLLPVPFSVSATSNEEAIYNYLTGSMGLNTAAACGVLANVFCESGFNPNAIGDNGTSYGICQWHDSRWTNLKNYCSNHGYDWTTLIGQLHFLEYELQNNYPSVYNTLKSVTNNAEGAYNAGYKWCYSFEVPANYPSVSVTRGNLAKNTYWPSYSGATGTTNLYNATAALNYAAAHWDKEPEQWCAEFVSNCINAGGCSCFSASCTALVGQLRQSDMCTEYTLSLNANKSITMSQYLDKLSPGDPVFYHCSYQGNYQHTVLCNGMDANGYMKAYSHHAANNGSTMYCYSSICPECGHDSIDYATVFHFINSVGTPIVTAITPSQATAVPGDTVSFTINANNATMYEYSISHNGNMDSYSMTDSNVFQYRFTEAATYYINANAYNDYGLSSAPQLEYVVIGAPTPISITASKPYAIVGDSVTFSMNAENATAYDYAIYLNGQMIQYSPTDYYQFSYTFNSAGCYTIEASASNAAGSVQLPSLTYNVINPGAPTATGITPSVMYPSAGDTVSFTINAQNATAYYYMVYSPSGSTSGASLTTNVFSYTFPENGKYIIEASATNSYGTIQVPTLTYYIGPPETGSITPSKTYAIVGETVSFVIHAANAAEYAFGIGDGTNVLIQETRHTGNTINWTFTEAGTYYIWCTAYNAAGETTAKTLTYQVVALPSITGISASKESAVVDETVVFTMNAENATEYAFGIGDGTNVLIQETRHSGNTISWTFTTAGTYYIWGTAYNDYGSAATTAEQAFVFSVTDVDPIDHDWAEPSYEWAADYSTATATRVCRNHTQCIETETSEATASVTRPAACEEKGETTYTASFQNPAFETQTVTLENLDALGHSWDDGVVTQEPTVTTTGIRTYTCTRCGETRTELIPKLEQNNPFVDVKEGKYFYEPVLWAVFHDPQITNGTDDTHFSPNKTCTRGQVVTFLWRAYGCPEPTITEHSFTDVKAGAYYYTAMLWAVECGITTGTSATTFGPNKECTRAQVVTFLWRAAEEPEPESDECPFTDVKPTASYRNAVLWAVENGITNGTSATTFSPNKTCTRGQVVTFLYNALAK